MNGAEELIKHTSSIEKLRVLVFFLIGTHLQSDKADRVVAKIHKKASNRVGDG